MAEAFDFIVIGAGAAGVSVAGELSLKGRVALVERESAPAYHSTSRSAAVLAENYGPVGWQRLSTASRPFFENPPAGFAEHPLLRPLGALFLATEAEAPALEESARELARRGVPHRLLPAREAGALSPTVRREPFALALHEPGCADIDAAALVQGYVRLVRRNGASVVLDAEVRSIERRGGTWRVEAGKAMLAAPILVNAAGAWADDIAALAGLPRRGVTPYRRTAITFDPPEGADTRSWPMTFDMAETWYFKPEAGRIMVSPVDKTPSPPCDCRPEDYDVAVAVDRIEQATTMQVRRIHSCWAGLRTFAPDEQPVIGPDPADPGFVWLAGQGGNGVMAAPAAARLAAALATGAGVPAALARLGVGVAATSPGRLPPQPSER
ncbi:MAG: FAD-binding oxidoreductase [Alphaproteobacteria bacterium]|nr:FAD-binding oxidoreductase [Alphaproteobacteria bacterium]